MQNQRSEQIKAIADKLKLLYFEVVAMLEEERNTYFEEHISVKEDSQRFRTECVINNLNELVSSFDKAQGPLWGAYGDAYAREADKAEAGRLSELRDRMENQHGYFYPEAHDPEYEELPPFYTFDNDD